MKNRPCNKCFCSHPEAQNASWNLHSRLGPMWGPTLQRRVVRHQKISGMLRNMKRTFRSISIRESIHLRCLLKWALQSEAKRNFHRHRCWHRCRERELRPRKKPKVHYSTAKIRSPEGTRAKVRAAVPPLKGNSVRVLTRVKKMGKRVQWNRRVLSQVAKTSLQPTQTTSSLINSLTRSWQSKKSKMTLWWKKRWPR